MYFHPLELFFFTNSVALRHCLVFFLSIQYTPVMQHAKAGKWGPRMGLKMYFLFKNRDFPASYVSLPGGTFKLFVG